MKKYELMTIFPLEDEKSKKGAEDVKGTLTKFGAEIEEEKPFGDRDLTYGFDGSKIKSMHKMFYKSGLTSFSSQFNSTINVEDISYMFSSTSIREIKLSNLNFNKVTNMSHMFEKCNSLMHVDTSNIDSSNVKDMSYMFHSCDSLMNLDLSNFNTSEVKDMSHMFQDCISLSELIISKFDTKNVIDMSYMFESCQLLNNIDLSSFTTSNLKNMSHMFQLCNSLNQCVLQLLL